MKKLILILLALFIIMLAAGCAKQADYDVGDDQDDSPVPEESTPEEISEIDEEMDDLGNLEEDLNFSELDDLDEDLQDLEW